MGAHYTMYKERKKLFAIVYDEDSKCIIMVFENGETVIVTSKRVGITNDDEREDYELLGWRVEGDECLFLLGRGYVVEEFLWVDLIKRNAIREIACDCHIVVYFVVDGEFYQKRYTNEHYYGYRTDKGTVNVGTLPLEWLQPREKVAEPPKES